MFPTQSPIVYCLLSQSTEITHHKSTQKMPTQQNINQQQSQCRFTSVKCKQNKTAGKIQNFERNKFFNLKDFTELSTKQTICGSQREQLITHRQLYMVQNEELKRHFSTNPVKFICFEILLSRAVGFLLNIEADCQELTDALPLFFFLWPLSLTLLLFNSKLHIECS